MPTKLILKFMCVWLLPRQSPSVISNGGGGGGGEGENITKILIAFGVGVKKKGGADRVHFV